MVYSNIFGQDCRAYSVLAWDIFYSCGINIVSTKTSKPSALQRLLDSQQISLGDIVAFGDDIPDVGMLEACGVSIAVANAVPEVKAVANYQTASNDDDGIAIVLEQMLAAMQK